MGCMSPVNDNIKLNTRLMSTKTEESTYDFTDFFVINKSNLSMISGKNINSPFLNDSSISIIPVSPYSIDKPTQVLHLSLYPIAHLKDQKPSNSPIDTIQITPNSIQSSQGKRVNYKGIFSFGGNIHLDPDAQLDYNIHNDPHIAHHQFNIHYDTALNKYFINEAKASTGLFKQIQFYKIENGMIVYYCQNMIQLTIDSNQRNVIRIHFMNGEFKNTIIAFDSAINKVIRFGRAITNEIRSGNTSVSRIQWTIIYENNQWIIFDGEYDQGNLQPSTNGLWFLIQRNTEISNESRWKTGGVIFYSHYK